MAKFNHFNFLAPIYDRFIKTSEPVKLRSLIGRPISGSLLDVGGGTGRISAYLTDMFDYIVIADSSMGMLDQAKNKNAFNIICTNSENLSFKAASFDMVIMVDALHHVIDYQLTVAELWRVVRPGGRIIIEEPDIHTVPVKIMAFIEKITLMRSHFISPESIRDTFEGQNGKVFIEKDAITCWVVIDKY